MGKIVQLEPVVEIVRAEVQEQELHQELERLRQIGALQVFDFVGTEQEGHEAFWDFAQKDFDKTLVIDKVPDIFFKELDKKIAADEAEHESRKPNS